MLKPDKAFDAAVARINAMSDAIEAREAKFSADTRLQGLIACLESLEPKMVDGFAGGKVVFAHMFSSNHKRRARVRKLVWVRQCQLNGRFHAALNYLREAAAIRCAEKLYLSCETMQAEHDEGRVGDTPIIQAVG